MLGIMPGLARRTVAAEARRAGGGVSTCCLTGKSVDARRAKRIGLVDEGRAAAHPREHRPHDHAGSAETKGTEFFK